MCLKDFFQEYPEFLLEGALGERLKREFHLIWDSNIAMANLVYSNKGRTALKSLWEQYAGIMPALNETIGMTHPQCHRNI